MARKYTNGAILVTLFQPTSGDILNVHANGHILQKRVHGSGWRQWAIIPIWGLGSVVSFLLDRGYNAS